MTVTAFTSLGNQHGGYTDWLFPAEDNRNDIVGENTSSTAVAKNTTVLFFDEDEYLETRLGYRYRSIGESVTLTFVYCLVLFTGVVGNVVTCVVIIRNSYMHTATNCYLFSLAVSDTLALVLGQYTVMARNCVSMKTAVYNSIKSILQMSISSVALDILN